MAIYAILTRVGKTLRGRYEGTKKEAQAWADGHYIKGSCIVERDTAFEKKWKIKGK